MVGRPLRRHPGPEHADPTRVRSQPALNTSPGTIWLVIGAAFTVICLVPLVSIVATGRAAAAVATVTIVLMVALYAAMVAVRLSASPGPRRLQRMAICFLGSAAVALVGMIVCVMIQWGSPLRV
jgi:O-antigen/teichoic acid export membrane protein